jgi:hypothetical protein
MSKAVGNWTPHTQPKGDSKPQARCNFKSGREHAGPVTQFSRFVPAGLLPGQPRPPPAHNAQPAMGNKEFNPMAVSFPMDK